MTSFATRVLVVFVFATAPTAAPDPARQPAAPPAERLGRLFSGLLGVLAVHAVRDRSFAPLALLIWHRLNRTLARFTAIARRFHAGTLRTAARPRRAATPRPGASPPPRDPLPRRSAWLLRRVQPCAVYGHHLAILLEDPQTRALLAAAPQARRLLRPLWRMLCSDPLPDLLRAPPPATEPAPPRTAVRRRRRSPPQPRRKPRPALLPPGRPANRA